VRRRVIQRFAKRLTETQKYQTKNIANTL